MKLNQLHNVRAPAPTDGQALLYDDASGKWTAGDIATGGDDISVTINDAIVDPAANTGTLNKALSWIAQLIKGITGKSSWLTPPAISLETLNVHATRHHVGGADALTLSSIGGSLTATQHGSFSTANTQNSQLHHTANDSFNGFMPNGMYSKLNGIESGATADQSATEIRSLLLTVDGPGSGIDADLVDGKHASELATTPTITSSYSSSTVSVGGDVLVTLNALAAGTYLFIAAAQIDNVSVTPGNTIDVGLSLDITTGTDPIPNDNASANRWRSTIDAFQGIAASMHWTVTLASAQNVSLRVSSGGSGTLQVESGRAKLTAIKLA